MLNVSCACTITTHQSLYKLKRRLFLHHGKRLICKNLTQYFSSLTAIYRVDFVLHVLPSILVSKCFQCFGIRIVYALVGLVFLYRVAHSLYGTHSTTKQSNTEECVNILIEVEYTFFASVEFLITYEDCIQNTTCDLFSVLTNRSAPLCVILKVRYETSEIRGRYLVEKFVCLIQADLICSLACDFTKASHKGCEVCSEHLGVVLDGCRSESLLDGLCRIHAFRVPNEYTLIIIVKVVNNIARHSIESVRSHTTCARSSCHSSSTCYISKHTSTTAQGLCCKTLTETLESITSHSITCALTYSRCRVDGHLYHEGDRFCSYLTRLVSTAKI